MVLAVVCRELGPPEGMTLEKTPRAALASGEARVGVKAIGINFPDILMVAGKYQLKPPLPFTPGVEAAGIVLETGAGVTDFAAGDKVVLHVRHGAYADEIVATEARLMALPEGYSFVEGATYGVGYNTAHHALRRRGALAAGETLLVHGAAGGVGLAAVEIGKAMGARVIGTASSPEKLAVVKTRGADHVIDYTKEDFVPAVKALTDGRGADVIYDPVGGSVFERSLRCINWGGRLLVIGFASGGIPSAAANRILIKGCAVLGVRAGEAGRRDPAQAATDRSELAALIAARGLRPHVSHILPLERFAEGMNLLTERKAIGRVALTVGA